jgi:diaminopimelate decarboxylase
MKAMGRIPHGFAASPSGEMMVGGHAVTDLIAQAGDTPLFVYDGNLLRARMQSLRAAMPSDLNIHYAMKANPYPPLVRLMTMLTDGIDVASAGEMAIACTVGARHISFAGPGKRDRELEAAIRDGTTLNLESEGEARRAIAIGERIGITPKLAIRINPDFDLKGSGMRMGGGAKPFGIDADRVPALVRVIIASGAEWRGFHIYAGSQALDAASVADTQAQTVALAARMAEAADCPLPHVNLGGGFGVPYFPNDVALNVTEVGARLGETLAARPSILSNTQFAIELGRYLVAEAGVYLCRVVDRKVSHGEVFLITDGGLHHQLAASGNFGTVVRRNYPVAVATRFVAEASEVASVVGCLCTPLDRLADQVSLPMADENDVISVFMAGAYGASASPASFLGHPKALEMMVNE